MSEVVSYADQIEAVRRELKLRESVYPRRVSDGKMTQALADRELARMRAVLRTLELVQAINRDLVEAHCDGAVRVCVSNEGLPVESLESSIETSLASLFQPPADLGRLF